MCISGFTVIPAHRGGDSVPSVYKSCMMSLLQNS